MLLHRRYSAPGKVGTLSVFSVAMHGALAVYIYVLHMCLSILVSLLHRIVLFFFV